MTNFKNNEEFFSALRGLIDKWCDRRCLTILSRMLGPYIAFSGLTDSWGDLCNELKLVRAMHKKELTADEMEVVRDLISTAEDVLDRH